MHGAYPRKSYLCVAPLDGGRTRWFRLKGYSLGGGTFPLGDGTALVAAAPIRGQMNNPKAAPRDAALLRVSLEDGKLLQELGLPSRSRVLDARTPPWSPRPQALFMGADGLHVSPLPEGASGNLGEEPPALEARVGSAAFAPALPVVAATSFNGGGGQLSFIETLTGQRRSIHLDSPDLVQPLGPGHWTVAVLDEDGRNALVELDASGAVKVLATAEGPFETVAAGPRWLYAVSMSSHGTFDPRRKWLHPREIRRIDLTGQEPEWRAPWTQRQGKLLAVDEAAGRLWFAITDRDAAGAWSLPLERAKLAAAVPDLDGKGPLLRAAALGVVWLLIIVLGTASSMAAWFFIRGGRR